MSGLGRKRASRLAQLAAVALAGTALATPGCGGEGDQAPERSPEPRGDELRVTVWPEGRGGEATTATYSCPEDAGKPCAIIDAWTPETLAPTPASTACTEIYGGPQEARIVATLDGEHVDANFSRANGCEIERFDRVLELLEEVLPGVAAVDFATPEATTPDQEGSDPSARIEATMSSYVRALTERNGERLCDLFAAGALDDLELPEPRGTCPASLEASIGYRDPRGLPAWRSSRILSFRGVRISGDEARATVTVRTLYAGRPDEPSIEDDVVYLRRSSGRWLLAQPSVTLYRAIGTADVPPRALAAP